MIAISSTKLPGGGAISFAGRRSRLMASRGPSEIHSPQPIQRLSLRTALSSSRERASMGQTATQASQPLQDSGSMEGRKLDLATEVGISSSAIPRSRAQQQEQHWHIKVGRGWALRGP